jgi:ATP-dependent DNA ligase
VRSGTAYFEDIRNGDVDPGQLELARQLVERYTVEFNPEQYKDRYQDALLEIIKQKITGTIPMVIQRTKVGKVVNFMVALKQSVAPMPAKVPRKPPVGTVLDGEIVVLDNGKPSFTKLQQREHLLDERRIDMLRQRLPATFIVFDLLYLKGRSMVNWPLLERRQALKPLIKKLKDPHLLASDYITGPGKRYFEGIEKLGLEGMMAKRLDSVYLPGKRSKDWLKVKVAQMASYAILGFVPMEETEKMGALIIGEQRGRSWVYKGKVGTGFSDRERQEFYKHLVKGAPLPKPPGDSPEHAIWRSTGMQCKVRFPEKTGTGKLRTPVFVGITG